MNICNYKQQQKWSVHKEISSSHYFHMHKVEELHTHTHICRSQ